MSTHFPHFITHLLPITTRFNRQLTHPLVSPILQGSLCNLCPLYVIAGNGEVLRDEIVYLSHRAAFPTHFPVRDGVLDASERQRENVQRFTRPTEVRVYA